MELVTVYISTYNRLDRLKRAILSVQNQTYKNIEIIISDDCSTDGTEEHMLEYVRNTSNVIYLRNSTNSGACVTRNNAIFNAKGKYITGLDDDDVFTEDRIQEFIDTWEDKYSFLCADFSENFNGELQKRYYDLGHNKNYNYKDLLFENVASNQIFTLTERLKGIDGFKPDVKRLQDWDTWLRLAYEYGEFLYIDKSLYIMNHDHSPGEERVSNSYSLNNAISDFLYRNKDIFGDDFKRRECYIKYLNRRLSFSDAMYWSFVEKKLGNFLRYFYQKVKSI